MVSRPPSGPWMGPAVDVPDSLPGEMRVELCGGDTRMAEQLLNDPQVGSPLEQVGREGVAEGVRAHAVRQPGGRGRALDGRPGLLACEPAPAITQEERPAAARCDVPDGQQPRARAARPAGQPVEGDVTDGHQALLVALADDPDEGAVGREILAIEADRL